jgi:hypothetical protein
MHVRRKIEPPKLVPKPGKRPENTRVIKIKPYHGAAEKHGYLMKITLPRLPWEPEETVIG